MTTQQQTVDGSGPRPSSSRVERKRGRRIQEILTTAAEMFGERGYAAVSLEDVAERLDVTKGSLYYYFSSKDELGTAAIETLGNEWTSRLENLLGGHGGSPAEKLRSLLREHIAIAVCEYPAALGLFLVPGDWPEDQHARIKELRRRHDRLFRRVVEEGVTTGEFRVPHVDPALQCMHASMSQAPLWCSGLDAAARDRAIEQLADTLMMLVGHAPGR